MKWGGSSERPAPIHQPSGIRGLLGSRYPASCVNSIIGTRYGPRLRSHAGSRPQYLGSVHDDAPRRMPHLGGGCYPSSAVSPVPRAPYQLAYQQRRAPLFALNERALGDVFGRYSTVSHSVWGRLPVNGIVAPVVVLDQGSMRVWATADRRTPTRLQPAIPNAAPNQHDSPIAPMRPVGEHA